MSKLPRLTEDLIRAWADGRSFSRGQDYARSGSVVNPRIQGTTLKAECWGSADEPYRVEVALSDAGILLSVCSCPVSLQCKHAVALLLTWLHHPERFREEDDLRAALSRRSQEDLIHIIFRMIDRYPDAAAIAELPFEKVPGDSKSRQPPRSRPSPTGFQPAQVEDTLQGTGFATVAAVLNRRVGAPGLYEQLGSGRSQAE